MGEGELIEALDARVKRRVKRRAFFGQALGAAALGGAMMTAGRAAAQSATPTPTPSPTATATTAFSTSDYLNFALNLEYLEANFYAFATTGSAIASTLAGGITTAGAQGAATGGRAVNFTDPVVAQYAREIAADELAHITFLRSALGSAAVAQPAINLSGSASVTTPGGTAVGAFTAAARAAGVIGASDIFDPFASDENFLIGSYLLTDVGVTAYRGSARLITNKAFIEAAAGILTTECYHDGVIRSSLWQRGLAAPTIYTQIQQISDTRDGLDGATDTDQGIGDATTANLVPTNAGGLVLGRTPQQVLNVVYQNRTAVNAGGFYPAGVNGNVRTSGAN